MVPPFLSCIPPSSRVSFSFLFVVVYVKLIGLIPQDSREILHLIVLPAHILTSSEGHGRH